ncbi:hypothetical protein ISN76_13200 [Dyella halodurans]|uniref:Uncharacterized protein n=1 Tax=Dyella halodurans TaxID=1920171 RepID=A0ABV9C0B6_9GAMM|nr:hypothetical protein [Dyella halodurans]
MRSALLAIGLVLIGASTAAFSSDELVIVGVGTLSCGKYVSLSPDKTYADMFISWSQGYLSARNDSEQSRNRPMRALPDGETIKIYLDKYCRDHPLSYPFLGVNQMFGELPFVTK